MVEGEPVTSGPVLEPVAREVVERLIGEASDVLTVLLGEGANSAEELVEACATRIGARGRSARGRPAPLSAPLCRRVACRYCRCGRRPTHRCRPRGGQRRLPGSPRASSGRDPGRPRRRVRPERRGRPRRLSRVDPDVVLVDYRLPGLDGVETTAGSNRLPRRLGGCLDRDGRDRRDRYFWTPARSRADDRDFDDIVSAIRQAAGRGAAFD